MLKFFKIFLCAALIFSFSGNCSAARTVISDSDIANFMESCNRELKANDPNSSLDVPKLAETFKSYADTMKIAEDLAVRIVYTTKNDKLYMIRLDANKYDENVKSVFEGMNIIFLKALGLTDDEAKALTNTGDEKEWQCEGYISRLQKRYLVKAKDSSLTITATDK